MTSESPAGSLRCLRLSSAITPVEYTDLRLDRVAPETLPRGRAAAEENTSVAASSEYL